MKLNATATQVNTYRQPGSHVQKGASFRFEAERKELMRMSEAITLDLKFRIGRWYQLAYEDALKVKKELRCRADRERELDQQEGME